MTLPSLLKRVNPFADQGPGVNWHEDFIVHLAQVYRPRVYVELGLYRCALFNRIIPYANRLIGVDIVPEAGKAMHPSSKVEFIQADTAAFAKRLKKNPITIDMLFIDADHSAKAVKHDFEAFFPFVAPHGLILLHDAHPKDSAAMASGYCGDGYKTIGELSHQCRDYEMVTIPIHPGLAICRKRVEQLSWQEKK